MASFISTTFRSQSFHYFLALCRKYVLAVMHIYCTAIVQKILLNEFRETVPVKVALGQFF